MTGHTLVVRLDGLGDVLVCGPAVRAIARSSDRVTMLVSARGRAAAELLPGVDDVIEWACPWILADPPPVLVEDVLEILGRLAAARVNQAVILTSFHQSALPTALLLRLAGIASVAGVSTDYPGRLLDVRLPEPPEGPEPVRMLAIATGAGFAPDPGDDGRLAVRPTTALVDRPFAERFVVVHCPAEAPARTCSPGKWVEVVSAIASDGWPVVLTGTAGEAAGVERIAAAVGSKQVVSVAGKYDLAGLAALLAQSSVLVAGNTGPAHLAAAVGCPVVSLFAPVVPASRWAPYTEQRLVLGDQRAACRATRARFCPEPAHPCLDGISSAQVVNAVARLARGAPRSALIEAGR